ncbi:MAG: hypothetical protein ACLFUO_06595 [Candidatus Woesearchaeota archaeon]
MNLIKYRIFFDRKNDDFLRENFEDIIAIDNMPEFNDRFIDNMPEKATT